MLCRFAIAIVLIGSLPIPAFARANSQEIQGAKRVDINNEMSIAIPADATLSRDPKAYPDHTLYFVSQADAKIVTVTFSMLPPRSVDRPPSLWIGNCPAMIMPFLKPADGSKIILVEYQQAPWGRRNVRFSYENLSREKAALAEQIIASLQFSDASACPAVSR